MTINSFVTTTGIIIAAAYISACASNPPGTRTTIENVKVNHQHTEVEFTREALIKSAGFQAAPQRVFAAMVEANRALGFKLIDVDTIKLEATFENSGVRKILDKPISNFVDCGRGAGNVSRADTYSITARIDEKVMSADGTRSDLATKITFTARNRGMSSDEVQCSSFGKLEDQIANLVATRLQ